jgi:hypothetical protein
MLPIEDRLFCVASDCKKWSTCKKALTDAAFEALERDGFGAIITKKDKCYEENV